MKTLDEQEILGREYEEWLDWVESQNQILEEKSYERRETTKDSLDIRELVKTGRLEGREGN
jgi:hypothetical protein